MRLVDADKLMEYCNNLKDKKIDSNDIARFPTAYDIDRVVEELEENYFQEGIKNPMCIELDKAIEIVKGGVNE